MRVLLATSSPASYMAPPMLGDEQVVCGPLFADSRAADGRYLTLNTPFGVYDLAAVVTKLGPAQAPDVVVCIVDATWRNQPQNLARFKCPRILVVADTHHLRTPLLGMMQYAMSQPFTRVVLAYDRHHAGFFRAAGIRNLYWFPGITFPHDDATVRMARAAQRTSQLAFAGNATSFHPRRQRLLAALEVAGIPLASKPGSQVEGLRHYGASTVGFNASLNGDLNLRVFEILSSGAALLTDELSPSAGLSELLAEGHERLSYRSASELVERANWALQNPDAARAMGERGARLFDQHLSAANRKPSFQRLVFDGQQPEFCRCPGPDIVRTSFAGGPSRLVATAVFYEALQHTHKHQENVSVALTRAAPPQLRALCETLPRVTMVDAAASPAPVDYLVGAMSDAGRVPESATRVWFWDATEAQLPMLKSRLSDAELHCAHPTVPLFRRLRSACPEDARKHILLYTDDPDMGGVAQYNHSILLALVDAGYRVTCVQYPGKSPLIAEQRERGVAHCWISFNPVEEFTRAFTDVDRAEDYICDDRPDLIIFSDCCPLSSLAVKDLAIRFGIPFLIVEGFVAEYLAKDFEPMLPTVAKHYAAAAQVIAVSQQNLELLRDRFGLARDRGVVIHYGRPDRFFAPRDAAVRQRLRAELGIGEDAVVCLTTARLSRIKGYWEQLQAIELLRRTPAFEKLVFVWLGDGDERKALEAAVAKAGLQKKVHILGHRWDVADWYDAADIFVLPSHAEGMPLSIMEAMAKGLPVIASAVSGIPEELGGTGMLLSEVAPSAVASAVTQLTVNSGTRGAVGNAARDRANVMFREEAMVQRTLITIKREQPSLEIEKAVTCPEEFPVHGAVGCGDLS